MSKQALRARATCGGSALQPTPSQQLCGSSRSGTPERRLLDQPPNQYPTHAVLPAVSCTYLKEERRAVGRPWHEPQGAVTAPRMSTPAAECLQWATSTTTVNLCSMCCTSTERYLKDVAARQASQQQWMDPHLDSQADHIDTAPHPSDRLLLLSPQNCRRPKTNPRLDPHPSDCLLLLMQ